MFSSLVFHKHDHVPEQLHIVIELLKIGIMPRKGDIKCRECNSPDCRCVLAPQNKLHLEVPSWDAVGLNVSATLTRTALVSTTMRIHPAAIAAMDAYFATGSAAALLQLLDDRKECVVGFNALLPVRQVNVFADCTAALRHSVTSDIGEWCVALPLASPARIPGSAAQRGFVRNQGVASVSSGEPYAVVSHNWPRTTNHQPCHASVLGIWWTIWKSALRKAEAVMALAEICRLPVWSDFLCIDQENAEERQVLLSRMGRIFADSGRGFVDCTVTPSVCTMRPTEVLELMDIEEAQCEWTVDERRRRLRNVVRSPWFSRCWTFQEELLMSDPELFDPAQNAVICRLSKLQQACIREYHYMHNFGGYDTAKREGWFSKAAAVLNHVELKNRPPPWNLGSVLAIRGKRGATEACDQLNSLLGILDVKCGQTGISPTSVLNQETFEHFLQQCSEQGDASWIVGEDPKPAAHLSWAPSSPFATFSTQAEPSSVKWLQMTQDGPQLAFHRAFDVLDVITLRNAIGVEDCFEQLKEFRVDGAWILEYCGVSFGVNMEDPLPVSADTCREIFANHRGSWKKLEKALSTKLPREAQWRVGELRNYLGGFGGRFHAWVVFETPVRRLAVLAKLLTSKVPAEVLFGFPAASKYRKTHRFVPVIIVDDSAVRRRVGWVWPCLHATLEGDEGRSDECVRCIRN